MYLNDVVMLEVNLGDAVAAPFRVYERLEEKYKEVVTRGPQVATRYRKKPVEIDAFQMTRELRLSNVDWPQWLHEAWNTERGEAGSLSPVEPGTSDGQLEIRTLEGPLLVEWGAWIVRGVAG